MNRTALRLATIAALTNGGAAPWPTLAGARVYDSRSDPVDLAGLKEPMPVIVVHTERDAYQRSAPNGRGLSIPRLRSIDLRIEIGINSAGVDENGDPVAGWPKIDADLEAMLDLFEWQVEAALFGHGPWALWWRDLFGIVESTSERFITTPEEGSLRLAAREILIGLNVAPDCLPKAVREGDAVPETEISGLMLKVVERVAAKGSGALKDNVARIAAMFETQALPAAPVYDALDTVIATIPEAAVPEGEDEQQDITAALLGTMPPP